MICRTCGKDNQPNHRFCQECGSPLPAEGSRSMRAPAEARPPVRGRLVLVRPDGHVAWRSDEAQAAPARFGGDVEALAAKLGSLDKIVDDAMMFAQVGSER